MKKHTPKRYAGMLSHPYTMTRKEAAEELRKWRKVAKVKCARYTNGNAYQSTDKFNPYKLVIATFQ